jgi:uncharacterized membrane protein YeaQ/YmgE (transglycosylase-associated protein family)
MTILAWVVLGLMSGFVASTLVGKGHGAGVALDTVLGVAGAIVGGLIFTAGSAADVPGFNLWSLFVATGGAVLALAGYRAVAPRLGLA